MFSSQGHIEMTPSKFWGFVTKSVRRTVNDYLLVGTPKAFEQYEKYCDFRAELGKCLQIHPSCIVVRGSAKFGFSIAPKSDRAWRPFSEDSDIDVAIADVDYFSRLHHDVCSWEERQRVGASGVWGVRKDAKRQEYRGFNCIPDKLFPPNTCVYHVDAMQGFDTSPYCGTRREISAFVFRDWWSLRNRCEYDLIMLKKAVEEKQILSPLEQIDEAETQVDADPERMPPG